MKSTQPHLLIVSNDSTKTGAPSQIAILAKGLLGSYKISACCPDGWLRDYLKGVGVTTYLWPNGQLSHQLKSLSSLYTSLLPDIIHCHGTRAGIVGRLAKRPADIKVIYTEHLWTNDYHLNNPLRESIQHHYLTKSAKYCDQVIAVSEAVADFVINKRHVPKNKVSVIYGAITPISAQLPQQMRLGTLGKLVAIKGVPTLLEAFAKISTDFPDLELVIGGDGPQLELYQDLTEKLGISNRCTWLGQVNNPASFYKQISIYVQPSTSEAFGLAAGEAMSCGRVVIASNVGGLPELITDRQDGLLFPAGNISKLAELIAKTLNDKKLFIKLSIQAVSKAAEFNAARFVSEHQQLYNRLLNEKTA